MQLKLSISVFVVFLISVSCGKDSEVRTAGKPVTQSSNGSSCAVSVINPVVGYNQPVTFFLSYSGFSELPLIEAEKRSFSVESSSPLKWAVDADPIQIVDEVVNPMSDRKKIQFIRKYAPKTSGLSNQEIQNLASYKGILKNEMTVNYGLGKRVRCAFQITFDPGIK